MNKMNGHHADMAEALHAAFPPHLHGLIGAMQCAFPGEWARGNPPSIRDVAAMALRAAGFRGVTLLPETDDNPERFARRALYALGLASPWPKEEAP